jgi:hypothetical protein
MGANLAERGILIPCIGYPGFKPLIVAPEPQAKSENRLEVGLDGRVAFFLKKGSLKLLICALGMHSSTTRLGVGPWGVGLHGVSSSSVVGLCSP